MLTELCQELKNWFVKSETDRHYGTFEIRDGVLIPSLDLKTNQYYRIIGSTFNDGVHKFEDKNDVLINETFDGSLWVMSVPRDVLELAADIDNWKNKYADATRSPYNSESFGGYSYSKSAERSASTWQGVFANELNKWRKIL